MSFIRSSISPPIPDYTGRIASDNAIRQDRVDESVEESPLRFISHARPLLFSTS